MHSFARIAFQGFKKQNNSVEGDEAMDRMSRQMLKQERLSG
jgi:hypothetical protein